ncbi:MAG: hypothetical protein MK078_16555 [Crocinitomicaceae bacterium]|nr:hypothetical protein [Crocinitomicaceae bacterium]
MQLELTTSQKEFLRQESIKDFGEIKIVNDTIEWNKSYHNKLIIPFNKIFAIGEYTTDLGPFEPDAYLVFLDNQGNWEEIPFNAIAHDDFLEQLSRHFDVSIKQELPKNKIDSRYIWPVGDKPNSLFSFISNENLGFMEKVKSLLYGKSYQIELTAEAKSFLNKTTPLISSKSDFI